jgi:chromate transport protein ChrA
MFWLWLIVAITIISVGVYVLGVLDWDEDQKVGLFWAIFIGALLWPLVLIAAVIVGPFVGLFWLGHRKREKRKKEKSTDNK